MVSVAVTVSAVCAVAGDISSALQFPAAAEHCLGEYLGDSEAVLDVPAVFPLDVLLCPGVLVAKSYWSYLASDFDAPAVSAVALCAD